MTTLGNETINKYQSVAPQRVLSAVRAAAAKTGVDFSFLMEKAAAESNFNPAAGSKTSSASGLYQFIESTWLGMVKNHGAKFGLGEYAGQIEMKNGKACVADCVVKEKILDLRRNPEVAALMAGAFTAENKSYLENRTQADVGATELYLAHFLGAGGAAKFIEQRGENGSTRAADVFPQAARANKNVFYDRETGRARSLDQVHAFFDRKFTSTPGGASPSEAPAALPSGPSGSIASAIAPVPVPPPVFAGQARPFFHVPAKVSPMIILELAEMTQPLHETLFATRRDRGGYNA